MVRHRIAVYWTLPLLLVSCQAPNSSNGPGGAEGRRTWGAGVSRDVRHGRQPKVLPETHFAAGQMFESRGALHQAVEQYRKAVAVNHSFVEAYHRLGICLSLTGRHDEAVTALRRAVELRPHDAALRNDLGFELLMAQRLDEGQEQLQRAIELQPDFVRAHVNLGIARAKTGRYDAALASFKTVLPEPDAYYNLALMYRADERYTEAAATLRHILTIDPSFQAARVQLDRLVEAGHVEEVRPASEPAEAGEPEARPASDRGASSTLPDTKPEFRLTKSSAPTTDSAPASEHPANSVNRAAKFAGTIDPAPLPASPPVNQDAVFNGATEADLPTCRDQRESSGNNSHEPVSNEKCLDVRSVTSWAELERAEAADSSMDPLATIRELEQQLQAVRNEIYCLDSTDTAEMQAPPPAIRVRIPMLISAKSLPQPVAAPHQPNAPAPSAQNDSASGSASPADRDVNTPKP